MSHTHEKSIQRYASVLVLFLAVAGLSSPAAWAHALLKSSNPAANSTIPAGEIVILLQYHSRVDPRHSTLSLLGPGGKVTPLTIDDLSAAASLSSKTTLTDKGSYELRWQALSGDGHITRGQVPFRVR